MFFSWIVLSITETIEKVSRKYLTSRYFFFPSFFLFCFFFWYFFLSWINFLFFFLILMTALRLTHTFFSLLLKYYSSEKRFQLSWCHACKKHYMKALAPLRYFTFSSGLPVVLTPSTRQVADARNTNSSKVPKRSVGLYKWSMAFPSVLPVNIEKNSH